jgi:hypothetical protein
VGRKDRISKSVRMLRERGLECQLPISRATRTSGFESVQPRRLPRRTRFLQLADHPPQCSIWSSAPSSTLGLGNFQVLGVEFSPFGSSPEKRLHRLVRDCAACRPEITAFNQTKLYPQEL